MAQLLTLALLLSLAGCAALGRALLSARSAVVQPTEAELSPLPSPRLADALPATADTVMVETLCQDIRSRTNGIVGLAELLLAAPLPEDQLRQAELVADSGRTMLRLLGDVLDVTRIDAGGLQLQEEPSDLRELLGHNVSLMQASARARGLGLVLVVDDAVPPQVVLDRARLRQVMLNLIGNAIKFTQQGRIDVQARLAQTPAGPQLAISVIDPGLGIARERQKVIFQPFFCQPAAMASSGQTPPSGTGLGLALSSRIVRAMGGDIALESAPGLGSCFTVRLPLVTTVAEPVVPPPVEAAQPALSGRRVLVVEQHALGRDVLIVLLEALGIVPTRVNSAAQAMAAVARAERLKLPFDLVLTDLANAGPDGLLSPNRLREATPGTTALPVIALLSSDRPDDLANLQQEGFQGHLLKPIGLDILARTLRAALATAQSGISRHGQAPVAEEQVSDVLGRLAADPLRLRELESRYHLRKEALFASLRSAMAMSGQRTHEANWESLVTQLSRLAGVAANFGDEHLGKVAQQLHGELRNEASPRMRHEALLRHWDELEAARDL